MKTNTTARKNNKRGFTLVEMIGVLAIIAVLAALLIPRIFQAINEARVNGAALSYNSIKSAAMSHFGKYGRFGDATGAALASLPTANYDQILLAGGFTEKPFEVRIGDTSDIQAVAAVSATTAVDATNAAYDLDGGNAAANDANAGSMVLEAVITGVALDDARELNRKIDGESLGEVGFDNDGDPVTPAVLGRDLQGRVKYDMSSATTGTVHIYIAHK